jgi:hypothetical protein
MFGCVSNATLALSLAGSIALHEAQVDAWYDWPDIPSGAATIQIQGAWYDESTDEVHLLKKWAVTDPISGSERFPAVQIWRRS